METVETVNLLRVRVRKVRFFVSAPYGAYSSLVECRLHPTGMEQRRRQLVRFRFAPPRGVAQLVARAVWNREATGSSPVAPTICYTEIMNNERFTQLFEEQVERCSNLLVKKNAEYSQGGDRLSNFRQPSSLMRMHPAEVAFCYDAKHIASIQKIVHDLSNGIVPTEEMWQEKITDYLNYGFLLNACVMEAIEGTK